MLSQKRNVTVHLTDSQVDTLIDAIDQSEPMDVGYTFGVVLKNGSQVTHACVDLFTIDDVYVSTTRWGDVVSKMNEIIDRHNKSSSSYLKIRKMLGE